MKNLILLLFVGFLSINYASSQDDLDAIFDDGDNTSDFDFFIGSDALTFLGGTPNVLGEVQYKNKIALQVGLGLIPFGSLIDISNPNVIISQSGGTIREIESGTFFDVGFKYLMSDSPNFDFYYYGSWKRWSYKVLDGTNLFDPNGNPLPSDPVSKIRRKLNIGTGYTFIPYDKIGFDAHLGIYFGRANLKPFIGFDLGLTTFYRF